LNVFARALRCSRFDKPFATPAAAEINCNLGSGHLQLKEPRMKKIALALAIAVVGLPLASAGWVAAAMIAF
jgi:hypothetical protein